MRCTECPARGRGLAKRVSKYTHCTSMARAPHLLRKCKAIWSRMLDVFPNANHTDGLRHFGSLHANILKLISRTLRHTCVSPNHYGVTADRATEMVSNKLLCDVTYKSHFWKERTAAGSHSRDADPQPSEPSWGKQTGLHWNHWCQDLCLKTSNSGTDSTK